MKYFKEIFVAYICVSVGIDLYLFKKMRVYSGREITPIDMDAIKSGFRSEVEVMKMELCENE